MTWTMRMTCECGRALTVTEGSAGALVRCRCRRGIVVPSFDRSALPVPHARDARIDDTNSPEALVAPILGIFVLGSIFLGGTLASLASSSLWVTGYTLALAGQTWLFYLILRECHPEAIVWCLLFPCFTWYFGYQRWDIAKVPLLCSIGGFALFVATLLAKP